MNAKRLLAAAAWLYAGWMVGSFIAMVLGLNILVGPLFGIAAGALVASDPAHAIWAGRLRQVESRTSARMPD